MIDYERFWEVFYLLTINHVLYVAISSLVWFCYYKAYKKKEQHTEPFMENFKRVCYTLLWVNIAYARAMLILVAYPLYQGSYPTQLYQRPVV